MKICLIRHGETDWNAQGKIQGRKNIPLNELGKQQAKECCLYLQNGNWIKIVSSPLKRTKETSQIIAEMLNIKDIIFNENLIERDYGDVEGKSYLQLNDSKNIYKIESKGSVYERMNLAINTIIANYYPYDIIVVSHGSAIKNYLSRLTNDEKLSHLENACISLLEYDNKKLRVKFYNKSILELTQ